MTTLEPILDADELRVYVSACAVHDAGRPVTIDSVLDRLGIATEDDGHEIIEAMHALAAKGFLRLEWKPLYMVRVFSPVRAESCSEVR